jgi:hypothetical protein
VHALLTRYHFGVTSSVLACDVRENVSPPRSISTPPSASLPLVIVLVVRFKVQLHHHISISIHFPPTSHTNIPDSHYKTPFSVPSPSDPPTCVPEYSHPEPYSHSPVADLEPNSSSGPVAQEPPRRHTQSHSPSIPPYSTAIQTPRLPTPSPHPQHRHRRHTPHCIPSRALRPVSRWAQVRYLPAPGSRRPRIARDSAVVV